MWTVLLQYEAAEQAHDNSALACPLQINEWVMMSVIIKNIPEEGAGLSQYDTVCRWRLCIFTNEGNIIKLRRRTQNNRAK